MTKEQILSEMEFIENFVNTIMRVGTYEFNKVGIESALKRYDELKVMLG